MNALVKVFFAGSALLASTFVAQQANAITLQGNATINLTVGTNFGTQTLPVGAGEDGNYFSDQYFDFNAGPGGDLFTIRSTSDFCGMTCGGSPVVFTLSGLTFDTLLTSVAILSGIGGASVTSFNQNSVVFTWADVAIPTGTYFTAQFNGTPSTVPLPAALPLLAAGLGALGVTARKRRSGKRIAA